MSPREDTSPGCDLRLMPLVNNISGIPTEGEGKNLIIVAAVNNVLHFRIFDGDGKVDVDTDEKRLTGQARQIEDLKKDLESLWSRHELTRSENGRVITAVTSIVTPPSPRVIWIHFEDKPPDLVQTLANKFGPVLITARTYNPGAFLVGLHSKYTHVHPASGTPHSAHLQRPVGVKTGHFFFKKDNNPSEDRQVHVFCGGEPKDKEPKDVYYPRDATSIDMSEFLAGKATSHVPIWIDAGMFQSVEEMLSDIMRQCRIYDSALPRIVLPVHETQRMDDKTGAEAGGLPSLRNASPRIVHTRHRRDRVFRQAPDDPPRPPRLGRSGGRNAACRGSTGSWRNWWSSRRNARNP